jgi:F-type H+-transporting ATPase subunit b
VRGAAADAAVAAAEQILSRTVKDNLAENLLAEGIAALRSKLN